MNLILFLLMLFPSIAFAALPYTGVIEIRQSATAGNVNGCGYNDRGGVDYSQQDTAQLTNTDGSAVGTTTFTSALSTFTSDMVGNYLHIVSSTGLTAGWYEIVTFTDANNVVLDRTPGTGTAATFYVGGACSLNSTLDDDLFETAVALNGSGATTFWVKYSASSYTFGEAVSISAAGATLERIKLLGYNTTRGDNPTGNNRPLINGGANTNQIGAAWKVANIRFVGTGVTVLVMSNSDYFRNLRIENQSTTASRSSTSTATAVLYENVEAICYRGTAFSGSTVVANYIGNYAHHSRIGFILANGTNSAAHFFNVVANMTDRGFITSSGAPTTGRALIYGNTLYGGTSDKRGVGMYFHSAGSNINVYNNIIYGWATGVEHATAQTSGEDNWNNYYNNTADVSDTTEWQKGAADLAVDPQFNSILEVTGTTGAFAAGGSKLIDTSKDFTALGVTAGDYLLITGGTGAPTAYWYKIDSISTTTNANDTLNVTIPASPGTNTTADKTYVVSGQNNDFRIGNSSLVGAGWPGTINSDKAQVGYIDIGALQKQVTGGSGGSYTFVQ